MLYHFAFIALSVLIIFFGILPAPSHAYLDPGTGSYLLQILSAGILGALFIIKTYWHKIKKFFVKKKPQDDTSTNNFSNESDDPSKFDS